MLELLLIVVVAVVLFIGPAIAIRALARIPFYWTFTPANTFALIVTEEDASGEGASGAGNLVDVLHGISGRILDKKSPDPMNWKFRKGEDPRHGFLFRTVGVQSMGNIFYKTRINIDRRKRFAREEKPKEFQETAEARATTKEELHAVTKVEKTRHVFYTGELTVTIKEADTADRLGLDFEIDFSFEREYPVRSVLRLADSSAFLTSLVEKIVNNTTVSLPAEAYIGGIDAQDNRRALIQLIENDRDFRKKVFEVIGFRITAVSLRDVSMLEDQRKLLQQKITAEKTAEARVIAAEGERKARILEKHKPDAWRVANVIKPAAENERTVQVSWADAYRDNQTLTDLTVVNGQVPTPVIPIGGK